MVIQNTFGVCRAGGTQMLADKQRMRVDSRQVNMDPKILGTPQILNHFAIWDKHILQFETNTFCNSGKQRKRVDSRQVNMDLEILGTPQMFNQNDGRQIQIQLLVLLGPQLPWQILFCSFQKTLAKI